MSGFLILYRPELCLLAKGGYIELELSITTNRLSSVDLRHHGVTCEHFCLSHCVPMPLQEMWLFKYEFQILHFPSGFQRRVKFSVLRKNHRRTSS